LWYNTAIDGNGFLLVSFYPYIISWSRELVKEAKMAEQLSDCPKCGGAIVAGDTEFEGSLCWRSMECENCSWEYREVYEFSLNETLDDCIELDDEGDPITLDSLLDGEQEL
jgi:hypothetical protein